MAVAAAVSAQRVLYPGSYVDVAPSFVFPTVTYVDIDDRAQAFFSDVAGVKEIIASHDNCLECGTCCKICDKCAIDWKYPDGAMGVKYKIG